jgi:putative MFS transporter
VVLHLPMYRMARHMGFHMAGMAMDAGMLWGVAAIVGGIGLAGFGLLPASVVEEAPSEIVAPPDDTPLGPAHWGLCVVLALALIIDIMKPASLGFVTPGMRAEYDLGRAAVAMLPMAALAGTVAGSFVWG